jgi:hypothetical protein
MNWGYKILIAYGLFVAGIAFLMIKSYGENTDLVATDYYAQELKYQQKIDESGRVNALAGKVVYEVVNNKITIHFPTDFDGQIVSGVCLLYYPANKNKDIKKEFSTGNAVVEMELPQGTSGLYELQLSWQVNKLNYYFEKKIFI